MPFLGVALALALYRQVDVLVIAEVAGEHDPGWYSAADTLFGSLLFPTTIILASIFPTALGRLHEHDPPEMRRLVTKTFSLLILVSVPVGLGAAVVGTDRPATLWAGVLGDRRPDDDLRAGDDPHIRNDVPRDCEYGPGSPTVRRSLLLVSAALTIPLDIVLIPWAADRYDNGAIGGALAFVVTETLQFVVGLAVITSSSSAQ